MSDIFDQIQIPDTMTDEKIRFLREAVEGSRGLAQNQLIPYFTGLIRKANQEKIQFTDQEVQFLVLAIRSSASPDDQKRIDQLLKIKKT